MASTGGFLATSQSSILLPKLPSQATTQGKIFLPCYRASPTSTNIKYVCSPKAKSDLLVSSHKIIHRQIVRASAVPEKVPPPLADLAVEETEIPPATTIGGDNIAAGGGGGEGGDDNNDGGKVDSGENDKGKKIGMSMSQKLTLGYAALVGVGGVMGYLKSGSQKSLLAGGISASLLYYVYSQLPTNPVFASCIGLGLSGALLGVTGSRFLKSGKFFPAGTVSIVSFVMTGGYLHGVMHSKH